MKLMVDNSSPETEDLEAVNDELKEKDEEMLQSEKRVLLRSSLEDLEVLGDAIPSATAEGGIICYGFVPRELEKPAHHTGRYFNSWDLCQHRSCAYNVHKPIGPRMVKQRI